MDRERMQRLLDALEAAGESIFTASGYPRETVEARPDTVMALGFALAQVIRAKQLVARDLAAPDTPLPNGR
jgi:hypothetical protein